MRHFFFACCFSLVFSPAGQALAQASWNGLALNEKQFFIISYASGYYDGLREAVERVDEVLGLDLSEEKKDGVVFRFGETAKISKEELQRIMILLDKAYADPQNARVNGADMVRLALKSVKSGSSEEVFFDLVKDTRELWATEKQQKN